MTTLAFVGDLPLIRPGQRRPGRRQPDLALVQLHDELWRVTRPDGDVLGYIEQFRVREGLRYRAKRLLVLQRRFIVMGEFWSIDDAIECFRPS
ncbi:hypothetical protein [Glaciihabitans sp. UYNi722]|uniref:hypothetical protein n=1 Tax=Glaciihabitans sp. UYNi722 TaxID=3156344 RepID=UPI003395BB71